MAAERTPLGRSVRFKHTGSCFDRSRMSLSVPGAHKMADRLSADASAFSVSRPAQRADPKSFLKAKGPKTPLGRVRERQLVSRGGGSRGGGRRRQGGGGAYRERYNPPNTEFRLYYERGDLPISIDHGCSTNRVQWRAPIEKLDYHHYLPIFFSGLREVEMPYSFLASQGVNDLLQHGPDKVLPCIPQLIIPLKTALNTRSPAVLARILRVIQLLTRTDPLCGQALVPYYRQLLPILNIFINHNDNLGDQHGRAQSLGDLIIETLESLEETGGEDAFINIKYLVPTYQSALIL